MGNEEKDISVYMDSCCFIDMIKLAVDYPIPVDRRPHIYFCRKFIEAARAKAATVYTSTMSVVECVNLTDTDTNKAPPENGEEIKRLIKGMLTSVRSGVTPVMPTIPISDLARDLRWNHGITCKPMDRVHLATAIKMNAAYFITTDKKIGEVNRDKLRKLGLNIGPADEFASLLPDEFRQAVLALAHYVPPNPRAPN